MALDAFGNVACATSTGGIRNKMVGRVGDSPFIGELLDLVFWGDHLNTFLLQLCLLLAALCLTQRAHYCK